MVKYIATSSDSSVFFCVFLVLVAMAFIPWIVVKLRDEKKKQRG